MVFNGIQWYWMVLDGIGWYWMVLDGIGWYWMVLDCIGWYWMVFDEIGWSCIELDGIGWNWMELDGIGWYWKALDCIGLHWMVIKTYEWGEKICEVYPKTFLQTLFRIIKKYSFTRCLIFPCQVFVRPLPDSTRARIRLRIVEHCELERLWIIHWLKNNLKLCKI